MLQMYASHGSEEYKQFHTSTVDYLERMFPPQVADVRYNVVMFFGFFL